MEKVISSTFNEISLHYCGLILSNGTWNVQEQGNRTGNPKFAYGSFLFLLCIPCPAGLRTSAPAPDGRLVWVRLTTFSLFSRWSHIGQVVLQAFISSPGGRFRFGLPGYLHSRNSSITLKYKCYGK